MRSRDTELFYHVRGTLAETHGAAPTAKSDAPDDNAQRGRLDFVERETGVEPATLSLGTAKGSKK